MLYIYEWNNQSNFNSNPFIMRMNKIILSIFFLGLILNEGCMAPSGDYNMELTLKASEDVFIKDLSGRSLNPVFLKSIQSAREKQKTSDKDFVTLFGTTMEEIDPNASLAAIFLYEFRDRGITVNSTNKEVLALIRTEVKLSIEQAAVILRTRVDNYGLSKKSVMIEIIDNTIHVKLSEIDNPERVKKLFQPGGKLEFWETYYFSEIYQNFDSANTFLSAELPDKEELMDRETPIREVEEEESTELSLLNQLEYDTLGSQNNDMSHEEYEKKFPLYAVLSPSYYSKQGQYFPGQTAAVGYAAIKDTSEVNGMLRKVKDLFPRNLIFCWTLKPSPSTPDFLELVALRSSTRDGRAALGGEVIVEVKQDYDQNDGVSVDFQMNTEGAKIWKRMTYDNIGRQIAIVVDDFVYSYPIVNHEIPSGRSTISGGNITIEEAQDLVNILRAGKYPIDLQIIDERISKIDSD